jgi:hypothetical protein
MVRSGTDEPELGFMRASPPMREARPNVRLWGFLPAGRVEDR